MLGPTKVHGRCNVPMAQSMFAVYCCVFYLLGHALELLKDKRYLIQEPGAGKSSTQRSYTSLESLRIQHVSTCIITKAYGHGWNVVERWGIIENRYN